VNSRSDIQKAAGPVDADTPKARSILENRIEEYGLNYGTITQDTPHGGKHLLFKIPLKNAKPEDI
jgi:hypothetical protein